MDLQKESLELHAKNQGKIAVSGKVQVKTKADLSLAYSPGVAEPCREIAKNPSDVYKYTAKGNLVAVISDGTAVLGLGDIGPLAALPVMEGKALLFKEFAGVDGFPICLDTKNVDEIVAHVKAIAPTFGGVNLEDISGPRCFEIEQRLKAELDIPVFHDDQHGTAVVMFAGLLNGLKVVKKQLSEIKVVILGAGAAGVAIAKLLDNAGVGEQIVVDRQGAIYADRAGLDWSKQDLASYTNLNKQTGSLLDVIANADVFIGVSAANTFSQEMVRAMAVDPIIFALSNPTPEIMPEEAKAGGAKIVATGRSDYPNQINNVLGFPGIFRGALDILATDITENMKLAAADAIAKLVTEDELTAEYIIPGPFDPRVAPYVAAAVAEAGIADGVARLIVDPKDVFTRCQEVASLSDHTAHKP